MHRSIQVYLNILPSPLYWPCIYWICWHRLDEMLLCGHMQTYRSLSLSRLLSPSFRHTHTHLITEVYCVYSVALHRCLCPPPCQLATHSVMLDSQVVFYDLKWQHERETKREREGESKSRQKWFVRKQESYPLHIWLTCSSFYRRSCQSHHCLLRDAISQSCAYWLKCFSINHLLLTFQQRKHAYQSTEKFPCW